MSTEQSVPEDAEAVLSTENERLKGCLAKANASAEKFEREWYLRGDENERLAGTLRFAAGYISAFEPHRDQHPQDVLDWMFAEYAKARAAVRD